MSRAPDTAPRFFENAEAFRAWLAANANTAPELIVGFHKVGSAKPSMSWPQSVDEALCVGWIDGVRKRIDAHAYQIRFTPRRPGSIWSTVNIAKVAALQASGRMQAAGLDAYARRTERRSSVYAYEQDVVSELLPAHVREFKKNKVAWAYWQSTPPSYRKVLAHWVVRAKQEATRARRLAQLIAACEAGERMLK